MKVLTVVGARPQFIKAAVVSRSLSKYPDIQEVIVHTGQHYDFKMSDIFFEQMMIPKPSYNLGISGKSHGAMTGEMISKIEEVLFKESPDIVLVYGDTNSTLAGAIAATKLNIPIAHVESGLRSYNNNMPEEINRILTDRISSILFCPTDVSVENLAREGIIDDDMVMNVGDVMYDASLYYMKNNSPNLQTNEVKESYYLATVHRAENTDCKDRLSSIFKALSDISLEKTVVMPMHPRTRKKLSEYGIEAGHIHIIDPVGYLEMIQLINNSDGVMTDSGGLQKEAYFFKKNCITLRDETEWTELIDAKVNVLAGASYEKIISCKESHLDKEFIGNVGLYGLGDSGDIIAKKISLLNIG